MILWMAFIDVYGGYIHTIILVGGFNPPEKYESQIGSSSQLLGKIKAMFQTTNQNITPKSSIYSRIFHYKPSILGYPYLWKTPYNDI